MQLKFFHFVAQVQMKITMVISKTCKSEADFSNNIELHFKNDSEHDPNIYKSLVGLNVPKISLIKRKSFENWMIEFEQDLLVLFDTVCEYLDGIDSECHMYTYNASQLKIDFFKYVYMHSSNALKLG